jgi:hypothetical protein
VPSVAGLERVLRFQWHDKEWVGRRRVGVTRLKVIDSYRSRNATKAKWLKVAIAAEAVAVAAVAVTIILIITGTE